LGLMKDFCFLGTSRIALTYTKLEEEGSEVTTDIRLRE
jgi:hypothetical protein